MEEKIASPDAIHPMMLGMFIHSQCAFLIFFPGSLEFCGCLENLGITWENKEFEFLVPV